MKPNRKEILENKLRTIVRQVLNENYVTIMGKKYEYHKTVKSIDLKPGDIFAASYRNNGNREDICKFIGVTDDSTQYGEQYERKKIVAYKTVRECLQDNGVRSLKALEEKQDKNEYGYHSYMIVENVEDQQSGAWYYVYNGSWCRGSGADKLSFTLLKQI